MAIAANFIFHRFMRASRFSEAIDTLFKKDERELVKPRSSLERDLIELSPFNQIRQTIAQFQRETSLEAELNVSLTARSAQIGESAELEPEIDRDLDLMLRMISKDEEEYKSLRSRFEKLLKQAKTDFSSETAHDSPTVDVAASTQARSSQTFEIAMKFRKQVDSNKRIGISLEELGIREADPLVLDIAGDGIDLTRAGEGAVFDIDADGKPDQTAWVRGDDALLVLDRNENGKIDDGSELFGDQNGAAHGFVELAKHDNNKDGRINRLDPVFKALKLYQDINRNGKVENQELFSLQQLGIKALNLNFFQTNQKINGNSLILSGSFERENGTSGQLADVLLGFRKI